MTKLFTKVEILPEDSLLKKELQSMTLKEVFFFKKGSFEIFSDHFIMGPTELP